MLGTVRAAIAIVRALGRRTGRVRRPRPGTNGSSARSRSSSTRTNGRSRFGGGARDDGRRVRDRKRPGRRSHRTPPASMLSTRSRAIGDVREEHHGIRIAPRRPTPRRTACRSRSAQSDSSVVLPYPAGATIAMQDGVGEPMSRSTRAGRWTMPGRVGGRRSLASAISSSALESVAAKGDLPRQRRRHGWPSYPVRAHRGCRDENGVSEAIRNLALVSDVLRRAKVPAAQALRDESSASDDDASSPRCDGGVAGACARAPSTEGERWLPASFRTRICSRCSSSSATRTASS